MGMSSSQARLLNLTARMHQIEYKAARLEAQKLQMANESTRVYNDYLNALEASKIQYKALNTDGSITYKDATLKALENGILGFANTSANTLFLQNIDTDKIMVTTEVANYYGLTSQEITVPLDTYVHDTTGLDKTIPVSFTPVQNNIVQYPQHVNAHSMNPITNQEDVINEIELKNYAEFNSTHESVSGTQLSTVSSITAGGNYKISTKEELQKLLTLSNATDTQGTTFTLTNDIDMSGINWSGIQNFCGTFDGNGYTISNLSGTQGLFATTGSYDEDDDYRAISGATIQNLALENININGNSNYVGGLVGFAFDTNISNCYSTGSVKNNNTTEITDYASSIVSTGTGGLIGQIYTSEGNKVTIENVSSRATVEGHDGVGGLIGTSSMTYSNTELVIDGVYAIGDVKGKDSVGGLVGYMYNDQDNHNSGSYDGAGVKYTGISNAYAGGDVTSTGEKSGGLVGCYLYWGDNGDFGKISNCCSTGEVNGNDESSAFIGTLYMKNYSAGDANYLVHFEECSYVTFEENEQPFGTIYNLDDGDIIALNSAEVQRFEDASDVVELPAIVLNQVPSTSDMAANIMAAITKADTEAIPFDYCKESNASRFAMASKISTFLANFSGDENNEKLYFLNQAICAYLADENANDSIAIDLYNDVMNNTTSNTLKYYNGKSLGGIPVIRATSNEASNVTDVIGDEHIDYDGKVVVPTRDDIATQLYAYFSIVGQTISETDVKAWVNNYTNSNVDMLSLANINDIIQTGEKAKMNAIYSAITSNTNPAYSDNYDLIDWQFSFTNGNSCEIEYAWDTSNSAIAQAITMWKLSQRGVEIVDDEQAESKEWLANMINDGFAVPTTFNPENLSTMSADQIISMDDDEFYVALNVVNTSVSTDTNLQEVQDKVLLKKAEAKYEADMKKIDMKDRKYDTDLAALDTERNAIKSEIDTLKTVAKDNVDRTFKLFG